MSGRRLEQQYRKLLQRFGSQPVTITLQELADQLCCTRRHMRNVLVQMQTSGWLRWQPETGRGHRSRLQLLRNEQQLLSDKAEQLLEAGSFGEAINLLGDEKQLIAPLLRAKLGFSMRIEQQVLRVPYYRPMLNLDPATPLRRSEVHLVRQIFNGLTRINEESGAVERDLAHHWRRLDPLTWRFFLRPAVLFHDGRELRMADVVASLTRCRQLPLFAHIRQVREAGPLSIVIELAEPDPRLPLLLTDNAAMILPADHASRTDFASRPVGTGPYRVAENDAWHLRLTAFDGYFGYRALLDELEVLMWPDLTAPQPLEDQQAEVPGEASGKLAAAANRVMQGDRPQPGRHISSATATWLSSSISDVDYASGLAAGLSGKPSDISSEMFLEQGGYFLLCDSRSPYWGCIEQRRWLQETLNPYRLAQQFIASIRHFWVPAGSLLPSWFHCMAACEPVSPFGSQRLPAKQPGRPVLRLGYYTQHPEYPMLAQAMSQALAAQGVALEMVEMDYDRWAVGDADVDLWLGSINFAVPEIWNVGAWLLGSPLLRQSISGGDVGLLNEWQQNWRNECLGSEQLVWNIVGSGWLQPLFHHWMRLKGPEQARGIHLNNLGWFDIKSTWLEPE